MARNRQKHDENFSFKWRFGVLFFIFGILQVVALVRLYQWQVLKSSSLLSQAQAEESYQAPLLSSRGVIKTSDGLLLAIDKVTYDIYIYLPQINNMESTLNTVSSVAHVDKKGMEDIINNAGKSQYFLIAKGVSQDEAKNLQNRNLDGITLTKVEGRVYPNGSFLASVLGFLGKDKYGNLTGEYGIEGYYNGDLSGQNGFIKGDLNQSGDPVLNNSLDVVKPQSGRDITLTIDSGIQKMVEENLKKGVENTKSKLGTAIVMDPSTGAVIAMAGYPTFDPNQYWNGELQDCKMLDFMTTAECNGGTAISSQVQICSPGSSTNCKIVDVSNLGNETADSKLGIFDNPSISFIYEPGSVMKLVTAASALQDNKITPDTKFNDKTGYIDVGGYRIYNWNKQPVGTVNMADILKFSSNVGATMVAQLVGKQGIYNYFKLFGFGDLTGIDLAGEQTGTIPNYKEWHDSDLATASFGQFFGATPLQIISMVSAIANNGVLMKPYIVSKLSDPTGSINISPQEDKRVMSSKNANELSQMMVTATTFEPYNGLQPIKQYIPLIASKTGSAQVPLRNQSGYDKNNINATYVGFAPYNNPKFVLLVTLEYPQTGQFAANTAVPVWESIAQNLFIDYQIPPQ